MHPALPWLLVALLGSAAQGQAQARAGMPVESVASARLTQPTARYDHAVLGDALEWAGMELTQDPCGACSDPDLSGKGRKIVRISLPPSRVFEDVAARVADLDGDGAAEVLVVETDLARGASLAVYDMRGRVTATPFIGQPYRWLAPLGVGDLDGDGVPEIAYVDRPHLVRDLVIVQYRGGTLREIARLKGLTNHRIGEARITGGIRDCGQGGEAILADADWSQVMAVRLSGRSLVARVVAPYSASNMARALACKG